MKTPYRWNLESYEIGKANAHTGPQPAGTDLRAMNIRKTSGCRLYRPTAGISDLVGATGVVTVEIPTPVVPRQRQRPSLLEEPKRVLNLTRPAADPSDGIGRSRKQFYNSVKDSPRRQSYSDYLDSKNPRYTTHNSEYGKSNVVCELPSAGYREESRYPDTEYYKFMPTAQNL